jgi:hypothetical protein
MNLWSRTGIIILIIGVSLLAGTIYRSNNTRSSSTRVDLAPNAWGPTEECQGTKICQVHSFFWAPRNIQLEVRAAAPIDVYVLNSKGITQWEKDQTIQALWSYKETTEFVTTLEIPTRDKYTVLLYNPTNEPVIAYWSFMIYEIERDLLIVSVAIMIAGLLLTLASAIITRKKSIKLNQ